MTTAEKAQTNDYNLVVADNIRAELSRERWSARKAAVALGVSNNWMHRRLTGETPLDPNDIVMFARFLGVDVSDLFSAKKKTPTANDGGRVLLKAGTSDYNATVSNLTNDREKRVLRPRLTAPRNRHDSTRPKGRTS